MYKLTIYGKKNLYNEIDQLIRNDEYNSGGANVKQAFYSSDDWEWNGDDYVFFDKRIGREYDIEILPEEDIIIYVDNEEDVYLDDDGDIDIEECIDYVNLNISKLNFYNMVYYPKYFFNYEEVDEEIKEEKELKSSNKLLTFCGLSISAGLALWLYNKK